jgi:hypothetical protein
MHIRISVRVKMKAYSIRLHTPPKAKSHYHILPCIISPKVINYVTLKLVRGQNLITYATQGDNKKCVQNYNRKMLRAETAWYTST